MKLKGEVHGGTGKKDAHISITIIFFSLLIIIVFIVSAYIHAIRSPFSFLTGRRKKQLYNK